MDEAVKEYIEEQKEPKRVILKKTRQLFLNTITGCREEFKWGVPVYNGGKFYIAAMKTRVHVGFAIKGLNKSEIEYFEGTGKTMRHIKIGSFEEYDPKRLRRLIRLVHRKAKCPPDCKSR